MKKIRLISSIVILAVVGLSIYLTVSSLNATLTQSEREKIILLPSYTYQFEVHEEVKSCSEDCHSQLLNSKWKKIEKDFIPKDRENIFKLSIQLLPEINLIERPLAILFSYLDVEEVAIWSKDGHLGDFRGGAGVKEFIKSPLKLTAKDKTLEYIFVTKGADKNLYLFNTLIFLGESSALTNIFFHTEREKVTTPLLYIMLSFTFVIIFLLFQFLSKKEELYWKKGILALFSSLSIFLTSYLSLEFIDHSYVYYYFILLRLSWSLVFICVFADIAKIHTKNTIRNIYILHGLFFFIVTIIQLMPNPEGHSFKIVNSFFLVFPVLTSLYIVGSKLRKSISGQKKGVYLTYIMTILFTLLIFSLVIVTLQDFTKLYYYDFFVLIFLAINSILEFRLNEKTIEKQREQLISSAQDKAISFTAKSMAHDLRKPLSQISSILENIETYQKSPELLKKISKQINANISHSEMMLSSLLDFSKEGAIELSTHSSQQIIEEAIDLVSIENKSVEISIENDSKSSLNCNAPRIIRVIANIIQNALEIESTSKIFINISDIGKKTRFEITNIGSYIEKENREKIFNNFYSKGKPNGTGLGLASCKKTIQLHGNNIWVDSNKENNSTSFFFELDSDLNKEIESKTDEVLKTYSSDQRIDIITCNDDLLTNLNLKTTFEIAIKENFSDLNYSLHSYTSGEELLKNIDKHSNSLLLCDYNLNLQGGKLNGLEVLEIIKESGRKFDDYLMTNWEFDSDINVRTLSARFLKEDCISLIESHLFFLGQRNH
ncbi:hypothetical protein BIY24_07610 [Halobacteriovorax marinus]|uniref:hybrid sensor histidine kinase/response regulator n=1 Tax=Halobacteriovorax marinus TaxID=97084 RepID=UPI000BC35148|nr:hybrid sensor histidine kinase/response regulator [Halobacteriovorax marinus]ATH07819.1 hypothetical protein BIY24_07610 [Halobacteriovorax marinus]